MLEKDKNIDRRTKRTQQSLKNALISLLTTKDFHSITVQDITNTADVNRATFYSHYHHKYDLLETLVDEILQEFEDIFKHYAGRENPTQLDQRQANALFVSIFEHIKKQADFYKVMLSRRGGIPGFWRRLFGIVRDATYHRRVMLQPDESQLIVPHDIMNSYLSSAILGVIVQWLESGMPYTPEYMAEKLTYMVLRKKPDPNDSSSMST